MKDNYKTEELLLSNKTLDELIKIKMEEEVQKFENSNDTENKQCIINEISKVPKDIIFSKKSCFKVFNKLTKQISFINGLQADGLLGLQNSIRDNILNGMCDVFSTENSFVKFEKAEV